MLKKYLLGLLNKMASHSSIDIIRLKMALKWVFCWMRSI